MRAMSADFFSRSPVMLAPLLALLIFTGVFLAILIRVQRQSRDALNQQASLPFSESEQTEEAKS